MFTLSRRHCSQLQCIGIIGIQDYYLTRYLIKNKLIILTKYILNNNLTTILLHKFTDYHKKIWKDQIKQTTQIKNESQGINLSYTHPSSPVCVKLGSIVSSSWTFLNTILSCNLFVCPCQNSNLCGTTRNPPLQQEEIGQSGGVNKIQCNPHISTFYISTFLYINMFSNSRIFPFHYLP